MTYVNPFHLIHNLSLERIDQGVDFSGSGPVVAIGNGTVIASTSNSSGWPNGGWLVYRLDDGPQAGNLVYVAESIRPVVHTGQRVSAGQHIADMYSFIETGWAANANIPLSQTPGAGSISGANLPGGGSNPTAVGKNFDELLAALGVHRAPNFNNPIGGRLPRNLKGNANLAIPQGGGTGTGRATLTPIFSDLNPISGFGYLGTFVSGFRGTASGIADSASALTGIVHDFGDLVHWISWFAYPAHWVRLFAGAAGFILLILALAALLWAVK